MAETTSKKGRLFFIGLICCALLITFSGLALRSLEVLH